MIINELKRIKEVQAGLETQIKTLKEHLVNIERLLSQKLEQPARKNGKTILLNPGHGQFKDGEYTTAGKRCLHQTQHKFHKEELGELASNIFYEGVFNYDFCKIYLSPKLVEAGFDVIFIGYQDGRDMPLFDRAKEVNRLSKTNDCILLDVHANAHNGGARGFQVHTSEGQTESDIIADHFLQTAQAGLSIPVRRYSPKQYEGDFPSRFYMNRKTSCPSITIETEFFDNLHGALYLDSHIGKEELSDVIVSGLKNYIYTL